MAAGRRKTAGAFRVARQSLDICAEQFYRAVRISGWDKFSAFWLFGSFFLILCTARPDYASQCSGSRRAPPPSLGRRRPRQKLPAALNDLRHLHETDRACHSTDSDRPRRHSPHPFGMNLGIMSRLHLASLDAADYHLTPRVRPRAVRSTIRDAPKDTPTKPHRDFNGPPGGVHRTTPMALHVRRVTVNTLQR